MNKLKKKKKKEKKRRKQMQNLAAPIGLIAIRITVEPP